MVKLLKNVKERKIKLTSIMIAVVLVASSVIYALASQKVTMSVTQVPNIDVVLTKSKTDVDLTNFENDLLDSLERKGITKDKVKISAVEAQSEVTTDSFEWEKDVSSSIGSISITDGGKNVVMKGNSSKAGKNAIWIMPSGNQEQEFNFGYNVNFGDSFNAAGMLLRVQRTGNTLTGYMLSFNNTNWKNAAGGSNGAIWEFTYPIGTNTTNFTKTLKKGLSINTSGTLNVKVTDKEIIISGGGLASPVTYTLEKTFGPGYGFFSDHYSHGCSNIGSFTLSNINLKTVTVKDFNEVLRAPDWRDGACKVLVNVSDVTNDQFEDNNQLTEIISRLMNDDIHYIGWGTDTNKEEMENTIATNDGKGLYLDNSDYEGNIEATAKYIKESLAGIADSKYIIANEPVVVKINPSSESTNTADSNYPNGKWKVEHNYTTFENNEGQYAQSGVYTEDVINSFPKPGSYKVYYEDELVTEIFAHRRPVASFDMQKNGSSLTLTSTSYDLDKQSDNNGIKEEEWSYKKMGTNVWNTGKLTTLDSNSTYIVKLRVKDFQDTWSTAATKYVTSDNVTLNPVAQYKITNKTISLYKELEVIDSSYDPAGLDLTSYTWTVKKDGTQVYQGATPLLDYKTLGAGTYTMSLVVKNSSNKVSEEFAQTYTITPDTTAPEFIADITEATVVNSTIDVNLTFTDKESGFKSYKYAITQTKDEPTSWTTVNAPTAGVPSFDSTVTISGYGKWYLHIKGTDKDGNESEDRVLGIYNIQKGYTIEIQTVDSSSGVGLQGAKIQVIGEYRDGKEISLDASVKTTDSNGKIILTDVPLIELSTLKISNPTALAGYEKNDMKIVTTDTSTDKIVVPSNLTSSDLITSVSDDGEKLTVKVPLTKKRFNLKITTVDASNTSIKLSGSKYILKYRGTKVAESTESADGVVTLEAPIGIATGVADDFILQQVTAANGYTATSNTTLSVTFAGDGSFISMRQPTIGSNSQVTIPDQNNPELIVRNSRGAEGTFAVSMNISDEDNTLTKIQGSKYKVKVETDTGLSYVTDAQTSNSNGNIVFSNLFGLGKIKLTFVHEGAPTGYSVTSTDKYITIENNNGTITYNQSSIAGVFDKVENKIVYVNLTNAKKSSTNSIQIKVCDAQNSSTAIEGVNFEVYKLVGNTKIGAGTTNENGIFRIDGVKSDGQGDIVYKIVPVNQSSTNIPSSILFSITFDASGYAISAQKVSTTTGVTVGWREDDSDNLFRRLAEVEIATSIKETTGETTLTINKKEAQTDYPIEGSSYKIRMKNNDDGTIYTNTYTTDSNGQFSLSVPDATSITIKITEVKAAPGYTLDSTTKELTLKLNSAGNLVPVESTYVNLDRGNVIVDSENNIKINIEEEGISLRYPKVKFRITKTDMSGSALLGGVYFKVTNTNTGEFQNVITDSTGYIETPVMVVRDAVDQVFEIEEVKAYPGYELPTQPFTIRFSFSEVDKIIKYTAEIYLTGDELLGNKNTTYNADTNEVTVDLTIKNNEDKSVDLSTYGIDIEKVDSDGNPVTGSKYDIEVRPFGTNVLTCDNKEIDSSIEVPMVQLTESKTTILLTEVQEALGYSKDEQMKVVTVVQAADGTLSWDQNSTSSDLQVSVKDVTQSDGTTKKVLVIRITAKEPEEVPSDPSNPGGGGGTTPTDPSNPGGGGSSTTTDVLELLKVETENTDSTGTTTTNTAYKIDDLTYQVEVLNTYLDTLVKVTPKDSNAKVTIDTEAEVTGTATKTVDLLNPTTTVTIKVESSDGTKDKTYTLNIVKSDHNTGSISDDLQIQEVKATDNGTTKQGSVTSSTEYEVKVSETATETDLTVITKDPTSLVSISGEDFTVNTQTTKIVLVNDTTTVNVKVQNADGSATQDYTVVITKVYTEDNSIPAEDDPNATFKLRLFNKNNGETWTRQYTYAQHTGNCCWGYWHYWWHSVNFDFTGAQRLPVFFKDSDVKGSHLNWGKGYTLLNGFSKMKVEARLVQSDGTVSTDIYETRDLRQNTSSNINAAYGSHTANFKKNYNNKEVEFTIIQDIPLYNHKKFDTMKVQVKFDNDGNVISGQITQGLDTVDIAVGGISQGETVSNIAYPQQRVDWNYYGWQNSDVYDEIEQYDSKGTNVLNVGILNTTIDNKFNIVLNLQDVDTNEALSGDATIVVSEKDTSSDWKPIETIPVNIVNGTAKVNLSKTYANRHLRFTITQTSQGTRNGYTYTNPANTSIEVELQLDDDGSIASVKEISTPSAKLEDSPIGGNSIEYTIYNEKDYNFSINFTKLDENGNPLPGVRLETTTKLITNADLSTGPDIDTYGSKLTDENGYAKLKVVLPTTGANKYYGKTVDITIREYYVPDNYLAYKDIKVRVMFTSQGKIAVAPELISEPEVGIVTLSSDYTNTPAMTISMSMKNKQLTDHPSFELKNVDSEDDDVFVGDVQYQITSWDQEEYENAHLTYKEQVFTGTSTDVDGLSIGYMGKSHALRTIIYTIQEKKTSQSYETNDDIILKVVYDEEGKIYAMPEILSKQKINKTDAVVIEGNPIGHTMIALKVRHELKPKFTININKYDTKKKQNIPGVIYRGTSQVKQPDGTYGPEEESRLTLETDSKGNTKIGFKEEHKRDTILYTIYEETGNSETKRGQIEVEFDAYGNVLNARIVDETNPKNYLEGTNLATQSNYISVRVKVEEFRMKVILKSTDPSSPYSLAGATFDIQNQYAEVSDTNITTDVSGRVVEVVGEVYRAETMTYTIKQVKAPADYDLIDDISFNITFADDGTIANCTPIMVQNKYAVTTTVKDADGNNMEIEIFTVPSDREIVVINDKDEDDNTKDIEHAKYDIKAVIVSPKTSQYTLTLEDGTGKADLGPDKDFFGKTISYSIKQTDIDPKYMICDQEIKVTVQYDVDGTIKEMYLQNPTDGSVKITDPVSGQSSTSMLNNLSGSYTFQIDMVNKRKTVMQVENQNIENANEKLVNSTFKIIEQGKSNLYSDTKQTGTDGTVDMYVGPYYRAENGASYIEKTYEISNPTPAFGFGKITNATFTLKYDSNGKVIDGTVSTAAQKYIELEFIQSSSSLYGTVDVRIIVKSNPNFTVGIEAVSETTGTSITGMKYEIRQSAPTAGTARTVITNNGYIAHADMGATIAGQMITYEIVEKQVATGYKYRNKDTVIARFEVMFDPDGYITNNMNGQRINITYGNAYVELNSSVDKTMHYDLDLKIKYEESEDFTIKIKNVNRENNADYIISDFTANLSSSSATGTTDSNGELTLSLGKRTANERATLTITQSNVQGSYAQINTIALRLEFDENGKLSLSGISSLGGNYATINVAYRILQPSNTATYVMEIEVYNNPQITFEIENVDQGDDTIKLQSTFTLTGTTGITNPITLTTDANDGTAKTGIESVPKRANVTYTITQDATSIPTGYGKILDIRFRVFYNEDGLIASQGDITNLGNGTSTADGTTVEFTRVDDYTIKIKIKSKREFNVKVETVDAYDESIKLGAQVYIREDQNRKSETFDTSTASSWGSDTRILGTNIANSWLTYEVRLISAATPPSGSTQTYYRDGTESVNIIVHFDQNGNVDTVAYSNNNPYISANCIIETASPNGGAGVEIKIKYIPNLTVNIKRTDGASGNGMSGKRIELSSNRMRNSTVSSTTNTSGEVTFDGGRIADDDGTEVEYRISETNSNIDYNYETLPTDMKVWVTYDNKGNINSTRTNYPDLITITGTGTRTLNVEIKSSKIARIILYNTDYYLGTERISGKYTITSSKGERTQAIITQANSSAGTTSTIGTPITLGKVYTGEDVVYTIHNDDAKYGYETLDDMQFTVHYDTNGTISVDTSKFTNPDKLELVPPILQTTNQNTANITLNVKSKPCLMVKIHATDKTYDQPIEKLGFEITDPSGYVNKVTALTDSNGDIIIPIKTAEQNTVVHYTIKQVVTNGGYAIIDPLTLIVKYSTAGTVDESGTYIANSNIASLEQNYSTDLYSNSKIRGLKVNVKLETKLGIGIYKIDGNTGAPLQGVSFKITEEELIGGNATNTWNGGTDINGEMTTYTRSIGGSVQKVRYTITETDPPEGYRPIEDIIIDVTFSSDKRVQSVTIVQKPEGVTIDPSNDPNVNALYNLKTMDQSREMEHIQITIKNDDKVKFKIVNLDKGFKDSGIDVPIQGSEFDVTVAREGTVIDRYETINNTQLVTNTNGEAVISMEGPGLLEIDYEQKLPGAGYAADVTNTGFIKVTKASNEYKITYNDSTDNIKYKIDEITGEVIIYIYNENKLTLNINNVDIDDTSILALNADQKIKAYYGEISDSVQTIISQTTNVVEYNNNYAYNNQTGNLSIDLGNTYNFINKKVVFEIDTITPATGYTPIDKVYVVVEFDKHGKITQVTNEAGSERLLQQTKDGDYEFSAFIGFGNLNKWHIKIMKESSNGTRINNTTFELQTYVDNVQTDIGIPIDPATVTTGDITIGGVVSEEGAYEHRGIQTTGNIKIDLEETQAAQGYDNNIGSAEITFTVTTDTSNPLEPRPVLTNVASNNNSVIATANASTRELEILVINEPKVAIEVEKVDEDGNPIGGIEFTATTQVEGDPSTLTSLGKISTNDSGKLQLSFPTTYINSYILVTLTETKATGYKQAQPIVIRIHTDQDGKVDANNVNIVSGKDQNDGKGGAIETLRTSSKIGIKVVNIIEEGYRPFKLQIIKENAVDSSVKIENVSFQVKITPEIGGALYQVLTTDSTGSIEIPKVVGEGDIKVELIELMAPNGYKLGSTDGYFTFTVNKSENGLEKVSSTLGQNQDGAENLEIDSANRLVKAHVPNELDKIGISIHKVDENNGSSIQGATFKLVDESIGNPDKYDLVTTNSKGIAYFAVDKKDTAGTYTYTLTEEGTPQGYKSIQGNMTIKIEYDSNGNIADVEESGDKILLTEQKDKFIQLEVSNEQEPLSVPLYNIEIINTDKANSSIVIPNASFDVTVTQELGSSQITQSIITDNNGIATIKDINGSGSITIDITEILPGDGYKKDTNIKNVKLTRNSQTGRFTILGATNAYPVYDEANNKIIIYVSNEKEKGIYSLIVNKIDENGNKIAVKDTEFDVTVQGNTLQLKTDEFGQAIVNKLAIPDGTDFDISIKETKEPTGYNKVTDAQVINATVQTIYEEKVLKNVTVKSGDAIAVINSNESMIEVNFTNQSIDGESLYLTSDVYTVNDDYVERVPAWTSIADYLANMKSNGTMTVYDKNGNEIADTTKYVGTGMVIKARKGNEEITKTIIVTGDVTGNGEIKLLDVSKVNQHFVGKTQLDGIYLKAADMNGDGKIKLLDVSKINQAYVNH